MANRLSRVKVLFMICIMAACVAGVSLTAHAATKVKVKTTKTNMYVGQKKTIKVTITGKTKKTKLVWKSSKPSVAKVSQKGKVTARKAGKTVVTVRVKGTNRKSKCTVTVGKRVNKLTINSGKKVSVQIGKQHTIKAAISPAKVLYKKLTYKSKNPGIATVSSKGVVTAKALGKATIVVTTKAVDKYGKKKTVNITVSVVPPKATGKSPLVYTTVRGTGSSKQTVYFIDKNYSGSMKVNVNGVTWNTQGTTAEGIGYLTTIGNLIYSNTAKTMKVSRVDYAEYWTITDLRSNENYYLKALDKDTYYGSSYALIVLKGDTRNSVTISN